MALISLFASCQVSVVLRKGLGSSAADPAPAPGHRRAEEEHVDRELVEFVVVSLGVDTFEAVKSRVRGIATPGLSVVRGQSLVGKSTDSHHRACYIVESLVDK